MSCRGFLQMPDRQGRGRVNMQLKTEDMPSWVRITVYLVSTMGFPVAVATWLLYRISPILEQQTRVLDRILWLLERGGM